MRLLGTYSRIRGFWDAHDFSVYTCYLVLGLGLRSTRRGGMIYTSVND